jgi:hypothetical protein
MRLLRFLVTLAALGALIYFAVAVPLGTKTLWQHIRAIAGTKESQELVDEFKKKAEGIVHRDGGATAPRPSEGQGDGDKLTGKERKLLRRLIREKLGEGTDKGAAEHTQR